MISIPEQLSGYRERFWHSVPASWLLHFPLPGLSSGGEEETRSGGKRTQSWSKKIVKWMYWLRDVMQKDNLYYGHPCISSFLPDGCRVPRHVHRWRQSMKLVQSSTWIQELNNVQ